MALAVRSGEGSRPPDGEIDLRALGGALWRHKWIVLIPTLVMATLATVGVQIVTPKYRSEARVLYEGRENIFLRPDAEKQPDQGPIDEQAIASQVQLLMSRDLARDVIRELKLNERPEFDPLLKGVSPIKVVLSLIGVGRDPTQMTQEERVLASYYERLSVFPLDKSRVIGVDFESADPELAARVANAIAEHYLVLQQAAKQQQARSASTWLAGEIEKLRKRVAEAEDRVEAFRAKSNLFLGSNNTTLSNQQLGEVNSQLAAARAQKADAEARARLIRDMLRSGKPIEASEVLNSELIRRLGEQRATVRAQLAEQSSTLLDGHPRIKELRAQLGDLEVELRREAERVARSIENDERVAGARVETLSATLEQLKRHATASNGQDVELRALEREAKAQRDLLESYLAKYREATARDTIASAPADARVISRAVVSNVPAFPKKLPIILIATIATFLLTAGFVATRQIMQGQYAAGAAPAPMEAPSRISDLHPAVGVAVSAIEQLAGELRRGGPENGRLLVVGAQRQVGRSLAALTLARALARSAKVVLVDLSSSGETYGAVAADPLAPGLGDLVHGTASFGDVITRDRLSRLHLVGRGRGVKPAEMIEAQRLVMTVDALARAYDHVVIDAGTLADAPLSPLAKLAARAVLVTAGAKNAAVKSARAKLEAAGFATISILTGEAATTSAAA